MEQILKIKKMRPGAEVPQRATEGAAGLDLRACIDAPVTLAPGGLAMIPSGIAVSLPGSGYAAFVFARSGLGVKHGISLSNGVGVIDSDYRGEICVGLCNLGTQPYEIQPGERIAQLVVMPVCPLPVQEAAELDQTQRGAGGFGSTGKRPAPPEARLPKWGRTKPSSAQRPRSLCASEKRLKSVLAEGRFELRKIAEDRLALPGGKPRFYESRRKQARRIDAGGGADKRISSAGMNEIGGGSAEAALKLSGALKTKAAASVLCLSDSPGRKRKPELCKLWKFFKKFVTAGIIC